MITVSVTQIDAQILADKAGFMPCVENEGTEGEFVSWTKPDRPSRVQGGKAGADYLWELDEVLEQSLAIIAGK